MQTDLQELQGYFAKRCHSVGEFIVQFQLMSTGLYAPGMVLSILHFWSHEVFSTSLWKSRCYCVHFHIRKVWSRVVNHLFSKTHLTRGWLISEKIPKPGILYPLPNLSHSTVLKYFPKLLSEGLHPPHSKNFSLFCFSVSSKCAFYLWDNIWGAQGPPQHRRPGSICQSIDGILFLALVLGFGFILFLFLFWNLMPQFQ